MKLISRKQFELGVHWKNRGKFYWRPEWSGSLSNYHRVENGKDFRFVNTWSYFIPTTIQLFIFNLIIYINIKPELISGEKPIKYVPFEETHLSLMNIPDGSWAD